MGRAGVVAEPGTAGICGHYVLVSDIVGTCLGTV